MTSINTLWWLPRKISIYFNRDIHTFCRKKPIDKGKIRKGADNEKVLIFKVAWRNPGFFYFRR